MIRLFVVIFYGSWPAVCVGMGLEYGLERFEEASSRGLRSCQNGVSVSWCIEAVRCFQTVGIGLLRISLVRCLCSVHIVGVLEKVN